MLILRTQSNVSGYEFNFVNEVEITSSWENLTDFVDYTIPKDTNFYRDGQLLTNFAKGDDAIFKKGDLISLSAGYDGGIDTDGLTNRFNGYIAEVVPHLPVRMRFEDRMYLLKQSRVGVYSKKNLTITQLLTDILPSGVADDVITDDRNIGYLRIKDPNTTVAMVLKHLNDKQGIVSYFRGGTLVCGFPYITENPSGPPNTHIFDARKNIINSDSLEYKNADDSLVNLTVVSMFPDNTKIEAKAGNPEGDSRTIYVYDVPANELQDIANQELLKFQYDGFRGSFETFLEPQVKHGDAVQIIDDRISDRNDVYLVKRVITSYGMSGGRQVIELDRRIN